MTNARRALLVIIAAMILYGCVEISRGWAYSRPRFDWKDAHADSYDTAFPAHWYRDDPDKDPSLGRRQMTFENRPLNNGDDPYRRRLILEDEGISPTDAGSRAVEIREQGSDQSPIKDYRFPNGVVAKTWTHYVSTVEIGIPVRWYVFKGSNGRLYTATHDIPPDWKNAWRYDRLFRRILGSMKFKDAPAPTKKS